MIFIFCGTKIKTQWSFHESKDHYGDLETEVNIYLKKNLNVIKVINISFGVSVNPIVGSRFRDEGRMNSAYIQYEGDETPPDGQTTK